MDKDRIAGASVPLWDRSTGALLRMLLVPNLIVAIPWLAGFLFAVFDRDRQAPHDRAAHTRVIYEIHEPKPATTPVTAPAPATITALIPMALGLGEGSETNLPLARAVIGGLMVSTFFTLFLVPSLYTVLDRFAKRVSPNDEDLGDERTAAEDPVHA